MNYDKFTKVELIKKIKSLERELAKDLSRLGSQAKAGSRINGDKKDFSPSEKDKIMHELHAKEVQLEMQNLELTEAQSLLEESLDKYADMYDFAPLGYLTLNQKGIIKEINYTGSLMLGMESQRLISLPFLAFVHKPDVPKFLSHLKECKNHKNVTTQLSIKNDKGKIVDIELFSIPATDYKLKSTIFRTLITDITIRKKAEEDHRFLAAIIESSDEAIYSKDMEGTIKSWNEGAARMYGYSSGEIIGKSVRKLIPDDYENDLEMILNKLKRGEKIEQYETVRITKYGKIINVSLTISPIKNLKGEIEWASVIARDITAQKKAEVALHESEEKFRQLAENIGDIFYITNPEDSKVFYISPAYEDIFKQSREELYQNPGTWAHSIKEEDRERIFKAVKKRKLTGKFDEEYRIVRPDKSIRWIHARSFPIKDEKGIIKIAGIAEDVTERKEIENILKETGQRLSTIFREIPSMIIISSLKDGRCIDVNDSFSTITGYRRHEVITRNIGNLGIFINTSDLDFISKKVMIDGVARDLEINIRTRKGAVKTILLNASKIEIKDELCILSVGTDITERKKYHEQIEASLKMKEIMLKEVHHRVKNNLQVVSSLLNLQANYITDSKAIEAFKVSQNRIRSMALLHEKLYKSKDLSNLNFAEYIKDLTLELSNSFSLTPNLVNLELNVDNVAINMDTAINIGIIISELVSNSLKHAFPQLTNLENPDDYQSENGKLKINISLHKQNEENFIMSIKDNGIGFPFHLNFMQTNSLGLQLVNTLVEQIGGNIELKRNGGTEFEIVIPSKKAEN